MLGAVVTVGCEPPQRPVSPQAGRKEAVPAATVSVSSKDVAPIPVVAVQEKAPGIEEQALQEILPERHPDLFERGDGPIPLGAEVWVTLSDGRQCSVVYSSDGESLTVDSVSFEMYSATYITNPFTGKEGRLQSKVTVKNLLIRKGGTELVIEGTSKKLSGQTVFSTDALRTFVDRLSAGEEPDFPLSSKLARHGLLRRKTQSETLEVSEGERP